MRKLFLPASLLLSLFLLCPQAEFAQGGPASVAPTEISADLGPCSALITVTGADTKPVYNAKVSARIRYGFLGAKKLDMETYTSAAGQVNFTKLPMDPKKPVYFSISKDDKLEFVEFKPDVHCRATFDVQLK
jgi:hypothetical protein